MPADPLARPSGRTSQPGPNCAATPPHHRGPRGSYVVAGRRHHPQSAARACRPSPSGCGAGPGGRPAPPAPGAGRATPSGRSRPAPRRTSRSPARAPGPVGECCRPSAPAPPGGPAGSRAGRVCRPPSSIGADDEDVDRHAPARRHQPGRGSYGTGAGAGADTAGVHWAPSHHRRPPGGLGCGSAYQPGGVCCSLIGRDASTPQPRRACGAQPLDVSGRAAPRRACP